MPDKQELTTILIVDDDKGTCLTLEDILEVHGYDCVSVPSGQAALDLAKKNCFDAVFFDLKLPDISGIELMAQLKLLKCCSIYFVITGNASVDNAIKALQVGVTDYFVKPLPIDKLIHSLKGALEMEKTKHSLVQSRQRLNMNYEAQMVINNLLQLALSERTLEDILQKALDLIVNISWLSFKGKASIFLADDAQQKLVLKAHRDFTEEQIEMCSTVAFGHCVCGKAALEKKVQFAGCKGPGTVPIETGEADHKHYCLPIMLNDKVGGVINLNLSPSFSMHTTELDFLSGIASTLAGIIQRKRLENVKEELEHQIRQAQRLEAMGTLAGGIAHDFNNILTAIIGFADITQSTLEQDSPVYEYVRQIMASGERARLLVSQILAFSRKGEVNRRPLVLGPIVKEVVKLLRASIPQNIQISTEFDQEFKTVLADPTQIHQVVMNLCTNAYHALQAKGGTISVEVKSVVLPSPGNPLPVSLNSGKYIAITVSDDGPGIEPELMARIFEPYFTTKVKGKGTGLGLSVVHGIVKSHGGEIIVDNRVGEGCRFSVYLPEVDEVSEHLGETSDVKDLPRGSETILIVDDEEEIVFVYAHLLEKLGYNVVKRSSSVEALKAFENNPDRFDLVITDVSMPTMSGDKLCAKLIAIRPDIPVILCTGFSELVDAQTAQLIGARNLMFKPMVKEDLAHTVRQILNGDKSSDKNS